MRPDKWAEAEVGCFAGGDWATAGPLLRCVRFSSPAEADGEADVKADADAVEADAATAEASEEQLVVAVGLMLESITLLDEDGSSERTDSTLGRVARVLAGGISETGALSGNCFARLVRRLKFWS